MTTKIVAQSNFDHEVKLIQKEEPGFAGCSTINITCYYVTYGAQTRDCGQDIHSAWDEFKSCTEHAMSCVGLLDDEE